MLTHQRIYSLDLLKTLGTVIIVFHHYQQYMEVTFASGINFSLGLSLFNILWNCFSFCPVSLLGIISEEFKMACRSLIFLAGPGLDLLHF